MAELVNKHYGLIHHCLKNVIYCPSGYSNEDLVQEGALALMRAIQKYDPDKGIRFSTYACTAIKNQINYLFRRSRGVDRLNVEAHPLEAPFPGDDDDNRTRLDIVGDDRFGAEILDEIDLNVWIDENFDPIEARILRLLMLGYKGREIADELGLTLKDVRRIQRQIRSRSDEIRESLLTVA